MVKPLCGIKHDGPSDGSVIKPLAGRGKEAFVLSAGLNPEYGKIAPYEMTQLVMDEAIRNAVACGADPSRMAVLDNFCWGDPTRPEVMGDLVQSAQACHDTALRYGTPFISGKDSFNNEYLGSDGQRHSIPPTLLISALGWMPDWEQALTIDLKKPGNLLYLVGDFHPAFGGSHYNLTHPQAAIQEGVPVCSEINPAVYRTFYTAVSRRLATFRHDLSEGGLAVTAAEMMMAGRLGVKMELGNRDRSFARPFRRNQWLPACRNCINQRRAFRSLMGELPYLQIGTVESSQALHVSTQAGNSFPGNFPFTARWKNGSVEGQAA